MAVPSFKERIDLERGDRKASEVHELILDNCSSANLDALTDEYENLELLSLVCCTLSSLKGLAKLGKLRRLELSDNKLEDNLDVLAEACPALTHINLSGNKIGKVDVLKPLAGLKHLTHLDLFNCPVTEGEDYREKVFDLLPNLVYLDGMNREGDDEPEDDSEGDELGEEEGEEEEYEEDGEDGVGLRALAGDDIEDDEEDFEPGNDDDDEEEEEEDADADDGKRGTKRKHREEEDEDDDDDGEGEDDDE